MAGVDILVPGVSTLTHYARYYTLYWALAARAEAVGLDEQRCRRLVRRAEVALAVVHRSAGTDGPDPAPAHGVESLARLAPEPGREFSVADHEGQRSYSPRAWGFWSQYGGSSVRLGTVTVERGTLRSGRHPCPSSVADSFAPLLEIAERDAGVNDPATLAGRPEDLAPLTGLMTATVAGRHDPDAWTGDDQTRRSTLRILARACQLHPTEPTWRGAFRKAVAYGPAAREDRVLADDERTQAWRGLLLRHHSVGAWRHLWAAVVDEVHRNGPVTREHLHNWITGQLPTGTVAGLEAGLPDLVDSRADPLPAELSFDRDKSLAADVSLLLLGARRLDWLTGVARRYFLGRRRAYLDPSWMAQRRAEYADRSLRDLGRRLVDDMLAQSRRVALRKAKLHRGSGTLSMPSRLHERGGAYVAATRESGDNIGLRIDQLGGLAVQLGLLTPEVHEPVTPLGSTLLAVPA
ncbi:hypothetical protein GA0070609_4763 [Micromonospora echinaurantiaca]|uniref:Uncharacterized protein n=2 Tax=Micromonospora echinaurantiaca TaxID=47857 RepID=A0A1C5JQH5_9ACTN|nr:hypothetical protein GA0070609_4763 [Micromonospora echinaurantiaca]